MADFNLFLPTLLRFEGGFVDDPADPGGATNKGITLKTFQSCGPGLLGVDPSLAQLKCLTAQQAGVIYKHEYWDKLGADAIALQPLADMLVDFYVNAGAAAVRALQQVLNETGASPPITVDGMMGPATQEALSRCDQRQAYTRLRAARIAYYQSLAARRPSLQRFLQGWLNRVNAFPVL